MYFGVQRSSFLFLHLVPFKNLQSRITTLNEKRWAFPRDYNPRMTVHSSNGRCGEPFRGECSSRSQRGYFGVRRDMICRMKCRRRDSEELDGRMISGFGDAYGVIVNFGQCALGMVTFTVERSNFVVHLASRRAKVDPSKVVREFGGM